MEFSIRSSGFLMFSSGIKDMKIMIMTKKKGGLKEGQVDEFLVRTFVCKSYEWWKREDCSC